MKYEVYRQIEVDKQILDILVATTFDEYDAIQVEDRINDIYLYEYEVKTE